MGKVLLIITVLSSDGTQVQMNGRVVNDMDQCKQIGEIVTFDLNYFGNGLTVSYECVEIE